MFNTVNEKEGTTSEGEIEAASASRVVRAVEGAERYAFLVGAGASTPEPAGIPLAGELVER